MGQNRPTQKPHKNPKKQLKKSESTLACFVQALQGMTISVELQQDSLVKGRLESADEDLNLVMQDATVSPLQGETQKFDWMYVKGKTIRYVHIPSKVDPGRLVEQNKRRIQQLRLLHMRENKEAPALAKGEF